MMQSIFRKLKNIIWYSSYYDFESNCIVRNRRIDLIDWDGILEVIKKYSLWHSINNTLLYNTIHNGIFNIRILEGIRYEAV